MGRLVEILDRMTASGIHIRYATESTGVTEFVRVQDRSRLISATKLVEEMAPVTALKMSDGRLRNVFFLWIVCLLICVIMFATETLIIHCVCRLVLVFCIKILSHEENGPFGRRFLGWIQKKLQRCF